MKHSALSKVAAVVLAVAMLLTVLPMTAFADWNNVVYEDSTFGTNGYYNVISKKDYVLVPGAATETEMVLNNAAGTRRQVLHIVEVDPSNPDVSIVPGYYGIDKDTTDVANQTAAKMTDMTAYYEDVLGYNVVAGMNTDLYYEANAPRVLIYNGQDLRSGRGTQSVLCVYRNAEGVVSCDVKAYNAAQITNELANGNAEHGELIHAVSVSFAMTVKDGALVSKTEERTSSAAARSMVGVKEDGTLVLVMNDGRGANNSVGFCTYELGESMLALGCKWAANCDGGGSSTFVSKRAGEDECVMRSVPCDGAERPTIHGIFVVSNVAPTGILGNIDIDSDYDYFAPGSTYTFGADAIDTHGYAMDTPADVAWALSDDSFGAIADGTFVSNGTLGDVTVQALVNGNVVGEKAISIVNPSTFSLTSTDATLPYSTPEKVRSITLPIVAKYGEADVFVDGTSVSVTLADPASGSLDGYVFTATDDASVAEAVITVTYIPTGTALTYTVTYGKGSEVLYDFEDGDISEWLGTDDTEAYLKENGVSAYAASNDEWETRLGTLAAGGQISWSNKTTTFLSTRENGGYVKNGENALGVTFDMRSTEFNSWVYSIIYNVHGATVLRDVNRGYNATAVGMWVRVPEGFYTAKNNGAMAMQLTVYYMKAGDTTHLYGTQLSLQYNGKNLNALKESDIPEDRWIYVSANISAYPFVSLVDPLNDWYRSPSFIRMYVKPSEAQTLTYYYDDITLDYSSAVDDRNPPVISNATYCTNDTNLEFDGQTLTTNVVSFDANIADYAASNAEGLDYSTAAIYVDGVKQTTTASGSTMSAENVVLSNGDHSIKFEIADKLGNYTTLTKSLTINAAGAPSAITLSGHNDLGIAPEAGSIYYTDLVAANIEDIDSVSTTLYLQTANTWELDHMIVADGFEATYEATEAEPNRVTVTITKTGETALTGEQTLVSIPVRIWTFNEDAWVGGDSSGAPVKMTAAQRYASSYGEPVLLVEVTVEKGAIVYTDNTNGTFGGYLNTPTAVTGNKTKAWHEHDAELVHLRDLAPTCTEDGYEGRTYCATCGSVVDWGTTIPATGHDYELVDGHFICTECGDEFDYSGISGLFQVGDNYYYAIAGNLMTGWQTADEGTYYFGADYAAVDGAQTIDGGNYVFENCILTKGAWINDGEGLAYYWAGKPYHAQWAEIEGETYHFNAA
ncbi:MAG: phosphodiester glycosidase family protein, partial [Clostridia bacterium]|nr:phosphodiester glycosidase family protein [Clostridia bacterium]